MRVRANRVARLLAVVLAGGIRLRGIGIASLIDEDLRTVLGDTSQRGGARYRVGFNPAGRVNEQTLWDVERLTEATRQSVPMAAQTGLRSWRPSAGGSCCACPRGQRQSHRHDVRRRFSRSVSSRRHALLDDLRCVAVLPDRQRRRHFVPEVRRHRHHRRGINVRGGGRPHRGGRRRARKADYDLVMELKDTGGNVVAISTNRYQMRSHGI